MDDCLFCRIAAGTVPARVLFSDDQVMVFHDIAPQAPVHLLVIPRRHITSLAETGAGDGGTLAALCAAAADAARRSDLVASGYRVVVNTGANAGQAVPHLHLHVLGGRRLGWPPG